MAVLATVISGVFAAAGVAEAFTHGLGTTPDIVIPVATTDTAAFTTIQLAITTFGTQTFTLNANVGGMAFSALVIKLHSIIR